MQKFIPQRQQNIIQRMENVYRRGLMNLNSLKAPSIHSLDSLDSPQANLHQSQQENRHILELTKRICNIKRSQVKMESLLKNCIVNLKARLAQEGKINKKMEEDVHELDGKINVVKQAVYSLKRWFKDRVLFVEYHNIKLQQPNSNSRMTHTKTQRGISLQTRYGFKSSSRVRYY